MPQRVRYSIIQFQFIVNLYSSFYIRFIFNLPLNERKAGPQGESQAKAFESLLVFDVDVLHANSFFFIDFSLIILTKNIIETKNKIINI